MKKLALLAAVLLLFGLTAGFTESSVDVSGNAEVTFGYNLDDGGMGFENSEDITFIVNLVPETTVASDMMEGWYGYIEFADFSVVYDQDGVVFYNAGIPVFGEDTTGDQLADDYTDYYGLPKIYVTEPTVMAKITNGTIFVKVYGAPAFEDVDLVAPIEADTDVSDPGDAEWNAVDEEAEGDIDEGLHEGGGLTVGYDSDMFDIEVFLADYDGYSDATDFADDWLFGAKVSASVSGAELTAAVGKGINGSYVPIPADDDADALYVGASASYTLDAGMMSVVPYVGIDAYQDDNVDFTFEFAGGADLTFTNDDSVGVHAFYSAETRANMVKGFDVELVLAEDAEAGYVPGLGVDVLFGYYDLGTDVVGDDPDMLATVDVSYMIGDIVPFVSFDYDAEGGIDARMFVDAGVKYTGIPLTTILAQWNSGDLGADPSVKGYIEVQALVEM